MTPSNTVVQRILFRGILKTWWIANRVYKVRRILTIHMTATKENGERQQCLISKKTTLHVQHTYFVHFFCRCFARLQRETSRNFLVTRFMEEMSYVFSFTFFFHCRSISPSALVAASISYFLTATTKLSCCSSNKKNVSFGCLSLSLDLCCPFSG